MKASIITILDNTNFGTYLQALALGRSVEKLGYEVEIIKYIRYLLTPWGRFTTLIKERGIIRAIYRMLKSIRKMTVLRNKNYKFLCDFLPVTREYNSIKELNTDVPDADVYITGSDQVWNSVYNRGIDYCYYLDFVPKGKKCISYAASIGMDSFPEEQVVEIQKLLRRYDAITVREKKSVALLNTIGIKSHVVLDPTLLLDRSEWKSIADRYAMPDYEPYLLVYSVETKKQKQLIEHYAKIIAKEKHLKIYEISYGGKIGHMEFADRSFLSATPDQFLNLMLHASFVIISSFHGTAFAINFNKQFITISPNRFNSRVENILEITGLADRMVSDTQTDILNLKKINYMIVNKIISEERINSMGILKNILKN